MILILAIYSCVLLSFGVLFSLGVQSIVQGHSFSNFLHFRPLATLAMLIVVSLAALWEPWAPG